ncbi:DNA methyltransferase [Parapedobacter lycopersici]|uniref:DNA methyltransferase n=1 Tax=Parapedobacter lycopersici TaxID=1864939 RepID=UPI00214D79ED|nr:DNA methyltransferase [Parapedobacter lycopersici]
MENKLTIVENRDCIEAMKEFPDGYFELAIVDPPYGIGLDMVTKVNSNARNKKNNGTVVKHKEKDWNNAIPDTEYFTELYRVSKHQIIWGCNYYGSQIKSCGRIVHNKLMTIKGTAFKWSEADIASCSIFNRIVMFDYQWQGNKQGGTINWTNTGPDARIHPTQKPIALYKYCLGFAKPGDKILDTHLGSGSSRIAAYEMGFDFWGYELDTEYFAAQEERFQRHIKQGQLFMPQQQYGQQISLLDNQAQ